MKQKITLSSILMTIGLLLGGLTAIAQGVTTSGMNGKVVDENSEALIGATVIAIHQPTGTKYGSVTNMDGYYYFSSIRVGGPYKVTVTYIGFETQTVEGINLALGEKRNIDFTISSQTDELEEVVITAATDDVINSGRTGAATNVSTETLNTNPSVNRSIEDFVRLSPQAASGVGNGGVSIAGSNSRYNNVTVDGAINNDAFGLNADGMPGSSSGSEPISLDAIEEISILVAPYDVTKGSFTGGGINAVTRSGTNEVDGSVYYYTRSEKIAGKTLSDEPERQSPFFNRQYGARVGGPIIKDKLFFFASAEHQVAETPNQIGLVSQSTLDSYSTVPSNVANISTETAQSVKDYLMTNYGYDAGTYGALAPQTKNTKLFGKIDWNINDNHQITFRHSYLKATDENISRNQNFLQFSNNGYLNDVESNSSIIELRSRIGDNMSNNMIVGYTSLNRKRNLDDYGDMFPQVEIDTDDGTTIIAGTQRSSVGNELRQGIGQFTNNFTIFKNRHVITLGTHNEFFKIYNSFVNRYPGHYEYDGLDNFLNDQLGTNGRFRVRYSLDYYNDRFQPVDLRFLQSGFYIQDEWEATDKLKLTGGLRLDVPFFLDEPNANPQFEQEFGIDTQDMPSGQLLWSPRVGFNYDLKGDESVQLRGGVGIFTGRVPFVWISNAYSNSGATTSLADVRASSANVPLYPDGNRTYEYYIADVLNVGVDDPAVRAEIEARQANAPTSQIDALDSEFKMPQNLRANLAVDAKLPFGMTGTFEAIYSKVINGIQYQNLQVKDADGTIPVEDNRPTFPSESVSPNFSDVFLLTNTNKGYQYSFTGQLSKTTKNLSAMIAYNYGVSKDVNGGTNTTANSGWEFNPTPGSPNEAIVSYAVWDLRHRIVANFNYLFDYSDYASTSVGVFISSQSGSPFSYMVNGDLNNDGSYGNDQAYIPADQSEIIFGENGVPASAADQAAMWNQLDAFIERDAYLSEHRGEIAERNGARTPWTGVIDMRIMQEFKLKSGNKVNRLQISLDIENVANLLKSDWGRQYAVNFNTYNLLQLEGFDAATGRPVYNYSDRDEAWTVNNSASIWRMQLGFRYLFGN
ncbi:TonB-dependent receptor [Reichenbachiella carrageenanivorans]|uniref:TonB-dependent receptor n=1 Tax=Reichenbachiella carrageenanivorans TaxID=2979869 RepID=A0ABY6CZA8_9BACT|nr:TonB-dependent receptor [Reichenbachiella carrageenanivorans]UXX79259.1 TonB-dependent receptor [Reichenbachiella carrageenanivorans]